MDEQIEAIQEWLQVAQNRLSCVEDSVVGLFESPTPQQITKIRNSIDLTVSALNSVKGRLVAAESIINPAFRDEIIKASHGFKGEEKF